VAGSNPAPATIDDEGLADAGAANPFRLPRLHAGIGFGDGAPACDARLLDHLIALGVRDPGPQICDGDAATASDLQKLRAISRAISFCVLSRSLTGSFKRPNGNVILATKDS
jgi:hypothetical protein